MSPLPPVLLVTGTDTGVGKTITTAAIAAALLATGRSVAVYKPTQAGTDGGRGDIDVVRQLAGRPDVSEGIRLPYPMAPVAAATRAGVALPSIEHHVRTIGHLAGTHDHVLVEGAGGLLVELDGHGHTLADLARALADPAAAVVVCRAGLGTLNHTALTLEALTRRQIAVHGVVIGSWPAEPGDVETSNRAHLDGLAVPLLGAIPEHAGQLRSSDFRAGSVTWLPGLAITAG